MATTQEEARVGVAVAPGSLQSPHLCGSHAVLGQLEGGRGGPGASDHPSLEENPAAWPSLLTAVGLAL